MRRMFSEKQIQALIKSTKKGIATLVDANGRDRFIEGEINVAEITGVTQTYGKWALSGEHLLLVLCISGENAVALTNGQQIASVTDLPTWIYDKIVAVMGYGGIIKKSQDYYSPDTTGKQSADVMLAKVPEGLEITASYITMSEARNSRIAFDLLIDAE